MRKYRALMRRSQRPASLGNVVRSAIYRARAERFAPPEHVQRADAAVRNDIACLVCRLQTALELGQTGPQPWRDALLELVRQAPRGIWTAEAKLLYDLQKACIDHEREIYTVDLVEWALSWGRRPIKRLLPDQRDVLMLKHLRSAAGRLGAARIGDPHRQQLARLIDQAQGRVEARLRRQLRGQIIVVLDAVGLVAKNLPERVARKKLVEELLDHVQWRGFLTIGNLRDAISRNKLKLPDLAELGELLAGDPLLRADRKLAVALDGVYRGGEFYMRWMQRISSLAFGTRVGRFVTRFAVVPFGGSYVALAGVHHVWELIAGAHAPPDAGDPYGNGWGRAAEESLHMTSPLAVSVLGLFLLCVINSGTFRRAVGQFCKNVGRAVRWAAVEPIRWIVRSPWAQRVLHSRLFFVGFRFVVKPLAWTGVAWTLLPEESRQATAGTVVLIFLTVNLLLNSRLGRNAEEVVADWAVEGWRRFGLRVIAGLFELVVDVFRGFLETVERLIYSVDEWLRFKSGERSATLAAKACLGVAWFFVAYVLRFCVNVLIEPQINPIKHFPVVTVSHKLLLPLIPTLAGVLEYTLDKPLAWTVAMTTIWSIPGVFGFLVWELKENWRLYAANRKRLLGAIPVGAHGETFARLLKPGFHSGVLPKRYAKLRRAERRARVRGDWRPVHQQWRAIAEVDASIRRCVEREFLELFRQSRGWQAPAVTLIDVRTSTNGVRLSLGCPDLADGVLRVDLDVESGWLTAGVGEAGWADRLAPRQRHVLTTAIAGLYKIAGIDLVRQQIEDQFTPPAPPYDVTAEGLVLWPEETEDVEVFYDLRREDWIAPQAIRGLARRSLPTLPRRRLVFAEVPLAWDDWVTAWTWDADRREPPSEPIAPVKVLPA